MIEIKYLRAESGANKFGTCNCCGKSSGEDPLMISVKFSYYGHGTLICLCDDCKKKLIEALPPANCSEIPNNSDTISRAKAIEALTEYGRAVYIGVDTAVGCIDQLPPAQPEPIRINLNEPIKVKLTDWGKEIYYHQYDKANQIAGREICKPKFPEEDENGYTEIQLWCFVELYGEHMGMTLPNVIEPLEIVYERRTG